MAADGAAAAPVGDDGSAATTEASGQQADPDLHSSAPAGAPSAVEPESGGGEDEPDYDPFSEAPAAHVAAETLAGIIAQAKVPKAKAPPPEATAPEATAPEAKAPEAKAPEATAPAAKAPEAKAPEAKGHTPESIARLPPKLRARLLARGILKEADVQAAGGAVNLPALPESLSAKAATAAAAATAAETSAPAQVPAPPDEPQIDAAAVAVSKAAGAMPMAPARGNGEALVFGCSPSAPAMETAASFAKSGATAAPPDPAASLGAPPLNWSAFAAGTGIFDPSIPPTVPPLAFPPAQEPQVPTAAYPKSAPTPGRTVYSSAPVLNKKRASPDEVSTGEDPSAKRPAAIPSPADARAAAAKAEGLDKAPVWVVNSFEAKGSGTTAPQGQEAAPVAVAETPVAAPAAVPVQIHNAGLPPPLPAAPPPLPSGPPLPAGWVRVPHDGDCYYWNTSTSEVSWEHPLGAKQKEKEEKQVFTEQHKVLWDDLGKIIGRAGINLKIIKASIGCTIHVPRQGGKGKGGAKGAKGKGKDKGEIRRGVGTGEVKLKEEEFAMVTITGDTKMKAMGGKRCLEVMLGYGRHVERALADLGVEVKMPSAEEMAGVDKAGPKPNSKDGVDPMDPAAYSDAPVGLWSAGMKKPGQRTGGGGGGGREPRDSKTANAERF